jgi:hypothetical protein
MPSGQIQYEPTQPDGTSGSLRHDGAEYAAPLAQWQDVASDHGWINVVESLFVE